MRGEQLRVATVSVCVLIAACAAFIRVWVTERGFGAGDFPIAATILVLAFLGYEALSLLLLRRRVVARSNRQVIKTWVDSALEGALPFVLGAAAILDTYANPYVVASGPLVMAALLLVMLAVLRLNPWMCLICGLSATVSYVALVLWVHATYPPDEYEGFVYPRAFFPIATGLLLGGTALSMVIAAQARLWLQTAWDAAEGIRRRKEVERELQLASDVQRQLLPRDWPDAGVFEIAASSRPAGKLGGDFYDWMPLSGNGVLLCLADVTGHGAASAMVGSACRAYFRAEAPLATSLPDFVTRLEEKLLMDLSVGNFVTMALFLVDTATGHLEILSAGHGPLLIIRANGKIEEVAVQRPPLGIPAPGSVESTEVALAAGESVLVVSDGILDRVNQEGTDLGLPRFLDSLGRIDQSTARALVNGVFEESDAFACGAAPPDDTSVLVVRRGGQPQTDEAALEIKQRNT